MEVARPERLGAVRLDLDHCPEGPGLQSRRLPRLRSPEQARPAGRFTPVHDTWWAQAKKIHRERDGTRTLIEMLLLGRHLALEHVVAGLATDTAALARAKAGRPRPPPHLKEQADAVREKSTPRGRNAVSAGSALAAREALCAGEALRTRGGLCTEGMLWAEGGCAQERCRTGQRTEADRGRAQPAPAGPRVPVSRPGTPGTRGVPRPDSGSPPRPPGPVHAGGTAACTTPTRDRPTPRPNAATARPGYADPPGAPVTPGTRPQEQERLNSRKGTVATRPGVFTLPHTARERAPPHRPVTTHQPA